MTPQKNTFNGILNVYKEQGYTSHDVVAKLRGILKQKKIGHTGTLDPAAEGVLPVCLGKATKVCELLTDKDKTYQAVLHLGVVTDTQDMTGEILEQKDAAVSEAEVREAILGFVGEYAQVPPMYSALKVNGKKLCDLAREGKTVERKARKIKILEITIDQIALPFVTMTVTCSKGTYIRTLCHDIGEKLGCGGCMESLLRTRVSSFTLKDSLKLPEIEKLQESGKIEQILMPVGIRAYRSWKSRKRSSETAIRFVFVRCRTFCRKGRTWMSWKRTGSAYTIPVDSSVRSMNTGKKKACFFR